MARTTTTNPFRRIASVGAILLALLVSAPALADTGDSGTGAAVTLSLAASTDPQAQATVIVVSPTGVEWTKAPDLASLDGAEIQWTDSGFRLRGVEWTIVPQGPRGTTGISLRGVEWTVIAGN